MTQLPSGLSRRSTWLAGVSPPAGPVSDCDRYQLICGVLRTQPANREGRPEVGLGEMGVVGPCSLLLSIPLSTHLGVTLGQSHLRPFNQVGACIQKVRIV